MNLGLLVFIGLPGSGKTTLINNFKKNFKIYTEDQFYFVHICYDDLIPFAHWNKTEWKMLRSDLALNIEKLVKAIKCKSKEMIPSIFSSELDSLNSFDQKIVLIVDDNMYFRSMRYTLYQISKKNCIGFCQVFVDCPLDIVLLKNSERQSVSKVPSEVIIKMADKIEPPNLDNNWENYSMTISAFSEVKDFCSQLFPLLNKSLLSTKHFTECHMVNNNIGQENNCLMDSKKNIIHQADLVLRKILGIKIKDVLSQGHMIDPQTVFIQLNQRKLDILNDIKIKNISLPVEILEDIGNKENEKKLYMLLNAYF